jgi:hypothetical protein
MLTNSIKRTPPPKKDGDAKLWQINDMCFMLCLLGEVHLALAWLEELLLGFDKYFSHTN